MIKIKCPKKIKTTFSFLASMLCLRYTFSREVYMNKIILDSQNIMHTLERLSYEILERHADVQNLLLVGIQRRGVDIAKRITNIIESRTKQEIPMGTLDINLYRDDWTSLTEIPEIAGSSIPVSIEGRSVILIDDVLFTGRTTRAALEAILDYGRPHCVELLVLVDRGHRELPIFANYVGKKIATAKSEQIDVLLTERDGIDEVRLIKDTKK